jgi:signal transduction histidine kinase
MDTESPENLKERLERRERELAAIRRITAALHTHTKPDELVRQTLDAAVETVDAAAGSILLHEPQANKLVFKYVIGESSEGLTGFELDLGQVSIVGQVFEARVGRITRDTSQESAHFRGVDEFTQSRTRNMVTVPLNTTDGRAIGAMQVLNKRRGVFDEQDLHVLEVLSSQAASAIETARLHEQAKLAEVVNLIGDISHDVKNMVTPIETGAQTLEFMVRQMWEEMDAVLDDPSAPDGWGERIRMAVQGVREFFPEAMEMTLEGTMATQERVREIADAVKGIVAPPHFEPASINEIADAVAKPLAVVAKKAMVTLDLDGLGEVVKAGLDRKRMYNALYNLTNNALQATPRGGRVAIRTCMVATNGGEPDAVQLIVSDTGQGMPEHIRKRLFTEQVQSTKVGGTGLGTRIVKQVVDAHHGSITVDSEEGRGTTFTLRLPLRQPQEEAESSVP